MHIRIANREDPEQTVSINPFPTSHDFCHLSHLLISKVAYIDQGFVVIASTQK